MRAFVHCRVATQERAPGDHYSLANQGARCRDYIKQRPRQLVKVLKDVARSSGRWAATWMTVSGPARSEWRM
jgi:hypothetical protein